MAYSKIFEGETTAMYKSDAVNTNLDYSKMLSLVRTQRFLDRREL